MKRLSKEELQDRARFNFAEEEIEIPEGSGEGILLRTPDLDGAHALETAEADREDNGLANPDAAAELLAVYCADPDLTAEEWKPIVKKWPSPEWGRVFTECLRIVGGTEEEARAAATEFRRPDDGS